MAHPEYEYLKLIAEILKNGKSKPTRGIHGIKSIFGYQMHFDMRHGFPLLTTKKMPFNILMYELLWFVSGSSNIKYLQEHKIQLLGRVRRQRLEPWPGLWRSMASLERWQGWRD